MQWIIQHALSAVIIYDDFNYYHRDRYHRKSTCTQDTKSIGRGVGVVRAYLA